MENKRPEWDRYMLDIANVVSTRSNCCRRHVGAVITKNNQILVTGYNGTPSKIRNCYEGGCPRCNGVVESGSSLDECLCVHAEQNAICQAAKYGVSIDGATIYITISPCLTCAKLLINAGIKLIIFEDFYTQDWNKISKLLDEAGVKYIHYNH